LEVVVLERGRSIPPGIKTHYKIVTPVWGSVGDGGGDEYGIGSLDHPHLDRTLPSPDLKGRLSHGHAIDRCIGGRRMCDGTDQQRVTGLQRQDKQETWHF
jgi:hypothetical protein